MSKFVTLDEAARLLGMSADELVEARSNGEIHGYRDGSSWKFKSEEVERFSAERGGDLGQSGGEAEDDLLGDLLGDDDQQDAVLLSEGPLGVGDAGSSTIIGGGKGEGAESDIQLAPSDADLSLGSDIELDAGSDVLASPPPRPRSASDSDVQLVPDAEGSDVRVVPGSSSNILGGSGTDELKLEGEGSGTGELDLEIASGSGTGDLTGGTGSSDLGLGSSQILGDDDDEEVLSLGDDDDLVLAGSGTGSDITMGGSDTGINLTNPSDSGLLLEDDALDLGSVSSLELPEDEAEDVLLASDEGAAGVQPEEDFNLGPTEVAAEPDDEGSSQVIKLEADAFGTEGLEGVEPLGEGVGFEAEGGEDVLIAEEVEELETVGVAAGAAEGEDISFSAVNIAWLSCGVLVLALSGILMIDVVRNMWSWNEATASSLASGIMEGIVSAVGMNR
jgi:excisionase family DNA binding protein